VPAFRRLSSAVLARLEAMDLADVAMLILPATARGSIPRTSSIFNLQEEARPS